VTTITSENLKESLKQGTLAPVLGREKSELLLETVFAIEKVTDLRSLRPLLQRG